MAKLRTKLKDQDESCLAEFIICSNTHCKTDETGTVFLKHVLTLLPWLSRLCSGQLSISESSSYYLVVLDIAENPYDFSYIEVF